MVRHPQAVRALPELGDLDEILDLFGSRATCFELARVESGGVAFPITGVVVGAARADAPTLALIGGVHGLERIGTHVVLAAMHGFARYLAWDRVLTNLLHEVRLVFVPLVNPVGMALRRRSNGEGVDLMRNAPTDHASSPTTPILGGHRLSPRLPWYRGRAGAAMQIEAAALCECVRRFVAPARAAIVVDVHSGFGSVDRLWFPYAREHRPFASLAEMLALTDLLESSLPHHVYVIEPVSRQYRVQGDLWDYLYDEQREQGRTNFLPLTLELGSWSWVRKNPAQLLDVLGGFNPMHPHRRRRTLRRHGPLFEFLLRAVAGYEAWTGFDEPERRRLELEAERRWYR